MDFAKDIKKYEFANLDFKVYVDWTGDGKKYERWDSFASEGKAITQGKKLGKNFQVRHNNQIVYTSKQNEVQESGPFSYGAKKARKGSVAAEAEAKRKRQRQMSKPPVEPKDQKAGVAKLTKESSVDPEVIETQYIAAHGKRPGKSNGAWIFGIGTRKSADWLQHNGAYAEGKRKAIEAAKKKGVSRVYVMESFGAETIELDLSVELITEGKVHKGVLLSEDTQLAAIPKLNEEAMKQHLRNRIIQLFEEEVKIPKNIKPVAKDEFPDDWVKQIKKLAQGYRDEGGKEVEYPVEVTEGREEVEAEIAKIKAEIEKVSKMIVGNKPSNIAQRRIMLASLNKKLSRLKKQLGLTEQASVVKSELTADEILKAANGLLKSETIRSNALQYNRQEMTAEFGSEADAIAAFNTIARVFGHTPDQTIGQVAKAQVHSADGKVVGVAKHSTDIYIFTEAMQEETSSSLTEWRAIRQQIESLEEMSMDVVTHPKYGKVTWTDEGDDLHLISTVNGVPKILAMGSRLQIAKIWNTLKSSQAESVEAEEEIEEAAQAFEIEYSAKDNAGDEINGKTKYKAADANTAKARFIEDNKDKAQLVVKAVRPVSE